jgi:hypothetical protein
MKLFHRTLKCDFCGRTLDEEHFYEWRDKRFCSIQCKREYRTIIKEAERKNKRLPYSSAFEQIYYRK